MVAADSLWGAIIILWSGAAAWMDIRKRRVWWVWFILGALAAGAYRLSQWIADGFAFDQLILITAVSLAAFQLWKARAWGGADAKMVMVLILAAPDWRLVVVLALVDLLLIAAWAAVRGGWEGVRNLLERALAIVRGEPGPKTSKAPLVAILSFGFWIYWFIF